MDLEKIKSLTNIIGVIAIPVVTLIVGNNYTQAIKEKELQSKYVESAIGVLSEGSNMKDDNIRQWAMAVVNKYSGVKLDVSSVATKVETDKKKAVPDKGNQNHDNEVIKIAKDSKNSKKRDKIQKNNKVYLADKEGLILEKINSTDYSPYEITSSLLDLADVYFLMGEYHQSTVILESIRDNSDIESLVNISKERLKKNSKIK